MKITVTNCIFDVLDERGSKRFEKNVFTVLKRNSIFGDVICIDSGLIGKFETFAIIEIDKKVIKLFNRNIFIEKVETVKQKRNLFFQVLDSQIENLKTQLKTD